MNLVQILVDVLVVVVIYLIASWVNVRLKLNFPDDILKVAAVILLILLLIGRISFGI